MQFTLDDWSTPGLIAAGGLATLGAAYLLLPRATRPRLRTPALWFVAALLGLALCSLLGASSTTNIIRVVATLLALLAGGRIAFVLVVDGVLNRRVASPLPHIFRDIFQGVLYVAAALIFLRIIGVAPMSLLTTSALLTAVIGLALQDTLGNLLAGLTIQLQRFVEVGDWVQSESHPELAGRVTEINWRETRILTLDQFEVVLPNSVVTKSTIRNYTRPAPLLRRSVEVLCPYEVPPHRVREAILEAVRMAPGVRADPPPTVRTTQFADSGISYEMMFFVDDYSLHQTIESAVRDRMWYALQRADIRIPFPIRTVHMVPAHEGAAAIEERERRRALERVDFLRTLPEETRQRLAAASQSRLYGPHEIILRQGDPGDELYIIRTGSVSITVGREGGSSAEIARLEPGQFFGEMSLMTGEPRRATVRAVGECDVVVVKKDALQPLLAENPALVEVMGAVLSSRLAQIGDNIEKRAARATGLPESQRAPDALLGRIRAFFGLS